MAVELQFRESSARGIAAVIESAVRKGWLAPEEPLPSVRELADAASVSPPTAAAALRSLRQRGLIVTRPRRGSFVSPRPPLAIASGSPAGGIPPGVRDLASGNPDPDLLPVLRTAIARLPVRARAYDGVAVIAELVAIARADLAESAVAAEHITLTSGALDGVERVLAAHLRHGDRVAVEDPCYAPLLDLLRAIGLEPVAVAIDDRGPQPRALSRALATGVEALVLTPRAQNPTGAALDAARAAELARVIARHRQLLVVEDDHQGAIAGTPGLSIVAGRQRWARVRSVAKALGPDVRLAFVAGDETTISRVEGRLAVGPGWVSEILQQLVVELMSRKGVRERLRHAETVYSARRQALLGALDGHGVQATGRSGFNVWIPVGNEAAVTAGLWERGWAVAPGTPFRLLAPPAVRVTTATLAPRQAAAFARDLAAVLMPARGRSA